MLSSSGGATRGATTSSSPQADASNDPTGDHHAMLQRQKGLMDLMTRQQNLSLLPKREVPVFDRDSLSFQSFINAFRHLIEDNTSSCQDRLYYLEQFTTGQARDLGPHVLRLAWISYWNLAYAKTQKLSYAQINSDVSKCANAWIQARFFCTSRSTWNWAHMPRCQTPPCPRPHLNM